MFVRSIVAEVFGENCYIVAPAEGEECVVIDPGIGVADRVAAVVREHGLRPAGVLLTHGHVDHVYDAAPVVSGLDREPVPTHVHEDDAYRLADPLGTISPELSAMLGQQLGHLSAYTAPEPLRPFAGEVTLEIAGLTFRTVHAPGHTEGSVLYVVDGLPDGIGPADLDRTIFSGDVLFAGSIGRTDLPGGDGATMQVSLREKVLPLPDSALVLPGHGPGTTMARERATNPFLQGL